MQPFIFLQPNWDLFCEFTHLSDSIGPDSERQRSIRAALRVLCKLSVFVIWRMSTDEGELGSVQACTTGSV
jgi:hypothetical protein